MTRRCAAAWFDGAIVALVFHGGPAPQRGGGASLDRRRPVGRRRHRRRHRTRVEDEPSADGGDVRQLVGGCAAALRRLHAATKPAPASKNTVGPPGLAIRRRIVTP